MMNKQTPITPSAHVSGETQEAILSSYLRSVPSNTEVNIQIITPTQAIRVRSHLIGVDRQVSIILHRGDDASWHSVKNYIQEGQNVVVRFVSTHNGDAEVIAFRSTIIKLVSVVGRWLVLSFPKKVQAIKLRRYSRQTLKLKAKIIDPVSGTELSQGELNDISLSGCGYTGTPLSYQAKSLLLTTNISPMNGDPTGDTQPLSLKLKVKLQNSEESSASTCRFGLEFALPEAERVDAVQKILMQSLVN